MSSLSREGITRISSGDIAAGTGGTPAQVRKDLAYFGEFGTRGVGYDVDGLNEEICKILGLGKEWNVILVGAGNLGSALCQYKGFSERGFHIVAVFDNDLNKVGLRLNGTPILPISKMESYLKENVIDIVILAVPAAFAQETAEVAVNSGAVKGILNFAPITLNVPESVEVRNVDLAVNLEVLSFNIEANRRQG